MSIKPGRRAAFTLVEMLVASTVALLVGLAVLLLSFYSSRSFVALGHYTDMSQINRLALDKMSLEIRQTRKVLAYATNSITLQDEDYNPLQFSYNPVARTLVRISGGRTNTYLKECDSLKFWIYQHTVISNTFTCYTPATITNARVVQLTWRCSRQILGKSATTDNAQSAVIVLRNR